MKLFTIYDNDVENGMMTKRYVKRHHDLHNLPNNVHCELVLFLNV